MEHTRPAPETPELALPHERDENTDPPSDARKVIKQAARDVDAGLVDTDNYTRAAAITASAPTRRRRPR